MCSGHFYEKRLSVRERIMKVLHKTATNIAIKKESTA